MNKILSALLLSTVLAMPALAADEKERKHDAEATASEDADASPKAEGKLKGMGGRKHMEDGDESKMGCGAEHRRVTLRVSWTLHDTKSMGDAKGKLDTLLKGISDDAATTGVKSLVAQNITYSVTPAMIKTDDGSHPSGYLLIGRAEYAMDSESAGIKLAEMLHKKSLQTDLGVRTSRIGHCVNTVSQ